MSNVTGLDTPASWGVVCTARETPEVLAAFAAHHVAIGASRIYLYLDEPSPRAIELLSAMPAVDITLCDQEYWDRQRAGARPKGQENRQIKNALDAYQRADVSWLAHVDADEFISPSRDLGRELACIPEGISYLNMDVRERVFSSHEPPDNIFAGMFRVPFCRRRPAARIVYGDTVDFFCKGLTGHHAGKSILRTGLDGVLMGIHAPRPATRGRNALIGLDCSSAVVLHYDGLTPNHWAAKMLSYSRNPRYRATGSMPEHKRRQILYLIRNQTDPAAPLHLHQMIRCVDHGTEKRLRGLGLIEDAAINPAHGLQVSGLHDRVDLSVAHCDRLYTAWLPQISALAA